MPGSQPPAWTTLQLAWARWASAPVPTVAIEGVIAWLDAGQPDQTTAAGRIGLALGAIVEAAQSATGGGATLPPECH